MITIDSLYEAILAEDYMLCKRILDLGIDVNQLSNTIPYTPLHYAVCHSTQDIIELFINRGADLNHPQHTNRSTTLLRDAYMHNVILCKMLLVNKIDPDMKNKQTQTTLLQDIININQNEFGENELCIANSLIAHGANVNAQYKGGDYIIHVAIRNHYKNRALLSLLLQAGADVNLRDSRGYNTCYIAFVYNIQIFKMVLKYDVDLNTPLKKNDILPLTWCINNQLTQCIEWFLYYGADPNLIDPVDNTEKLTTIMKVINVMGYSSQTYNTIKVLLHYNADKSQCNKEGDNLLQYAMKHIKNDKRIINLIRGGGFQHMDIIPRKNSSQKEDIECDNIMDEWITTSNVEDEDNELLDEDNELLDENNELLDELVIYDDDQTIKNVCDNNIKYDIPQFSENYDYLRSYYETLYDNQRKEFLSTIYGQTIKYEQDNNVQYSIYCRHIFSLLINVIYPNTKNIAYLHKFIENQRETLRAIIISMGCIYTLMNDNETPLEYIDRLNMLLIRKVMNNETLFILELILQWQDIRV